MTVETAYQFLKPTLEQFSEKERKALSKLITGEAGHQKKSLKKDKVPTEDEYRRKLIQWFDK